MINVNSNITSISPGAGLDSITKNKLNNDQPNATGFAENVKAAGKYLSNVDDNQQTSNTVIKDLLSGKNEDINTVVSAMAKADMSFKLLVGVRNKLISAYKETMKMPI